jgi:signal transduction histidine kinase
MGTVAAFEQIRPVWLRTLAQRLAQGEGVRVGFHEQLSELADCLVQALDTGSPTWVDPLLAEWLAARPLSAADASGFAADLAVAHLLGAIETVGAEVIQEQLTAGLALDLILALQPIFNHAQLRVAARAAELRVARVAQDLQQAQRTLERLDKSKSDFISVAAHELKTPLTLIEGYASMLREVSLTLNAADAPICDLLAGMDNGARRLREIIDDMIDVSMIDNNLLSLHFQPVWINRLVRMVQREFADNLSERRLDLRIEPIPGGDVPTFGDDERLFQALRNVVANAIKYTPDGGQITISGRQLPGFIEIVIADSGIGIDPEDHGRIFEKFGRIGKATLHSSGKTKFKGGGPGLGLPISKGIIEAHGGAIWVESPGYDEKALPGTTFHLLLPLRSEPPDDHTAKLFYPLLGTAPAMPENTTPGDYNEE